MIILGIKGANAVAAEHDFLLFAAWHLRNSEAGIIRRAGVGVGADGISHERVRIGAHSNALTEMGPARKATMAKNFMMADVLITFGCRWCSCRRRDL